MELITRCPSCQIAFHANAMQLKMANGLVRCGACLTVFDAMAHQKTEEDVAASTQDDNLLIYDDMDPLEAECSNSEQTPEDTQLELTVEPEPEQEAELELEPEPISESESELTPELSAPESEPKSESQSVPKANAEIESDESATAAIEQAVVENQPTCSQPTADPLASNFDPVIALHAPPLLSPRRRHQQSRRPWLTAACLLAALMLPLQYVYFYSDQLSLNSNYRDWLIPLCDVLGCDVYPLADLGQIKSDHLLVYSHPSMEEALLVEAILENRASFEQPFPHLLLYFDDLQGQRVAQRRFSPEEYLHGEMRGATLFPRNRPVRIRLAIADPGPNASNYSLLVTE